ncbi:MAG: hypothetical protein J4G05_04260 [Chlorobi bacterium]|nr:hypothetical protein [Chlorobiota bacterium]
MKRPPYSERPLYGAFAIVLLSTVMLLSCTTKSSLERTTLPTIQSWFSLDTILPLIDNAELVDRYTVVELTDSLCFLYYSGLRISDSVMGVLRIVLDQPDTRDTLWFEIPGNIRDTYFFVKDITVDASAMGILVSDHLLVYDLQSLGQENVSGSSVIPVWRSVPLDDFYYQIQASGDAFVMHECAVSSTLRIGDYTGMRLYRPKEDTLFDHIVLPNPEGVEYTLFRPRSVIAVWDQMVVVSDITQYRVKLYDLSGAERGVIQREVPGWIAVDIEKRGTIDPEELSPLSPKNRMSIRQYIDTLRPTAYSTSNIRRVDFLNDSTLLVTYFNGKTAEKGLLKGRALIEYDIWRRRNNRWELLAGDIPDFSSDLDSNLSIERMLPLRYGFKRGGLPNVLYRIQEYVPLQTFDIKYSELPSIMEQYLIEHGKLYHSLFLYSFKEPSMP